MSADADITIILALWKPAGRHGAGCSVGYMPNYGRSQPGYQVRRTYAHECIPALRNFRIQCLRISSNDQEDALKKWSMVS